MGFNVLIGKTAYSSDSRYLAWADLLASPERVQEDEFLEERRRFWAALLTPAEGPVPWSQENGNPNVRIARTNGIVRISGYLALGLPGTETIGFVRSGLHIVVNPKLPEAAEVTKQLDALGHKLCPEVPTIAQSTQQVELPTDTSSAAVA